MNGKQQSLAKALIDAAINALAIFTLTLGGFLLANTNLQGIAIKGPFITALGVAMIRFSLRLYREEGIEAKIDELPGVPDVTAGDREKKLKKYVYTEFTKTCKIF